MESFLVPYCRLFRRKLLADLITLSYVLVKDWKDPTCTYYWSFEIMAQWTDVYFLPEALCGNEFLWAQNILDSSLIKSQVKTKYLFFVFGRNFRKLFTQGLLRLKNAGLSVRLCLVKLIISTEQREKAQAPGVTDPSGSGTQTKVLLPRAIFTSLYQQKQEWVG